MTNEELYDRYAPKIERFFANKTSSGQDVSDLLHRTFVRLFAIRASGRTIQQPINFLYGIANNVLHEHWRERGRLAQHDDVGEHSLASLGSGASTLMGRSDERRMVLDALREVKLNYQVVLELFYWENKTYEQIAEMLDVSVGTVGTRLRRGKLALARILEAKQASEERPPPRSPSSSPRSTPPHHSDSSRGSVRPRFSGKASSRADQSSSSWS